MAQTASKLTTWQGACIITGYGVGSGIMALPYLVSQAGTVASLLLLVAAFFFSYCMHMMLAEIALGAGDGAQVVTMFRTFLFRGKAGKVVIPVLFVLVVLVLVFNLAAYVAGGADIIASFGVPPLAAKIAFYAVAAAVVFFGLKVLGISESVSVSIIIAMVALLAVASLFHLDNSILHPTASGAAVLAFFGMAMFAFVAFFSVPQVVKGLQGDAPRIRRAIVMGLGLNLVFILVITGCSLAASKEVTELAMIGWSAGIGTWAQIVGSLFTVLALLTTYWSLSLALSDIINEQTKLNFKLCWLIATLPSLLLVLFDLGGFLDLMRTAGGLIAILIACLVVPALRRCRAETDARLLGSALASTPIQVLVVLAFLLMAVGSTISI